ncbi:MAG: hypothetical protein ACPGU7_11980 [Gammaproteobacteria bacterium]
MRSSVEADTLGPVQVDSGFRSGLLTVQLNFEPTLKVNIRASAHWFDRAGHPIRDDGQQRRARSVSAGEPINFNWRAPITHADRVEIRMFTAAESDQ